MENFIVSARKYRPATFASVVGQNHITSTLRNAISRGQLAHAYLFCGPRGVGKTTCARIFAKAINCLDPGENAEACGVCESCRSFDEGRSFNIHELDAASNNSVEDIRNLTDQVRIPPQIGRYSVYIIDEVHMLSAAAFNAFLKTLEEPPAHAIFILATTEKHKIIPTILSRCQIFDFNRIRVSDGVEYMRYIADTEGVAYDEESLNLIARKADGGMRDALSMFDKAVSFCGSSLGYKEVATSLNILDYDTYFDAVDVVLAGDYGAALVLFDRVLAQGFSGQTFMAGLGSHLRDLLVAKNAQTAELLDVTGPLMARYTEQAALCGLDFLFDGIALLTDLDARIRVATNQRLLVELALMKLCTLASPEATESGSPEKKKRSRLAPEVALPPLTPSLVREGVSSAAQTPHVTVGSDGSQQTAQGSAGTEGAGKIQTTYAAMDAKDSQQATAPQSAAGAGNSFSGQASQATTNGLPDPMTGHTTGSVEQSPGAPITAQAEQVVSVAPVTAGSNGVKSAESTSRPLSNPVSSGIFGRSLSELMSDATTPQSKKTEVAATPVDPAAQDKIERHRDRFVEKLTRERPRIGVVFETMSVTDNVLHIKVQSEGLREDVLRDKTEILQLLAAVAGVNGPIELQVVVDETVKPARPIRIEDRLKHLTDVNPQLTALRKTLELEIE